jgi:hypothetical protein
MRSFLALGAVLCTALVACALTRAARAAGEVIASAPLLRPQPRRQPRREG